MLSVCRLFGSHRVLYRPDFFLLRLNAGFLLCSNNFQTSFKGDITTFSHFPFITITSSFGCNDEAHLEAL